LEFFALGRRRVSRIDVLVIDDGRSLFGQSHLFAKGLRADIPAKHFEAAIKEPKMNASEKQVSDNAAEGRVPKTRATKRRAPAATAPKAGKKPKIHSKPPAAARRGTKTAKILALLRRPAGASLSELRKATGWQAHSVRGFLSGAVKKKMGLHIDSVARDDGERVYRVASK